MIWPENFCVISPRIVTSQRLGKRVPAAMNAYTTIEHAVFSVRSVSYHTHYAVKDALPSIVPVKYFTLTRTNGQCLETFTAAAAELNCDEFSSRVVGGG
jgi:hypothetical protein